ncbi:MAG: rRNA maturation RNase YbeY [Planctomycetia bacterium]|nr:rRNA maturation RNase YbeY [Planctomycetia bacterium]
MSGSRSGTGRSTATSTSKIAVEIVDRQRLLRVDRTWLRRVVADALLGAGIARAEISLVLLDDAGIAELHDRWLGLDGPTDVLTFDLSDGDLTGGLQGDIAVSTETARRVARELGWQPKHELAYYIVHGMLHLAGEDDHDPADRRRMRARERKLMAAAGLPRPPLSRRRGRTTRGTR